MGKKNSKIRVSFVGNSSHEVTGSCIHIKTETKQILLECGLTQSCESPLTLYKKNTSDLGFKPKDIDFIFVNHMHVDHIGLIPRLYKKSCHAQIIAPSGSTPIAKLLLLDSAHIAQKDSEFIERRTDKYVEPIYDESDVQFAMGHWSEHNFDEIHDLGDGISFRFTSSGHILNSAQLELWIKQNNVTKKIVYTSDLGNVTTSKYYVSEFKPIEQCNLFIGETTYSDKARTITKKDRAKDLEKIKSVITEKCVDGSGRVLFPVFANDRCQNVLTHLYSLFGEDKDFDIPIVVDSPMATKISSAYMDLLDEESRELYQKVFNWKNVHFVQEYDQSKSWQTSGQPAVILSCSGMLSQGRSVQWAARMMPNSRNHILFSGYSAVGSLAAKIKEGKHKTLAIEGKPVANRCGITSLTSFSSHMQHDDLLSYYSSVNCEKVALVHGDYDSKVVFAKELEDELSKKNKPTKVVCVNKGTEILL